MNKIKIFNAIVLVLLFNGCTSTDESPLVEIPVIEDQLNKILISEVLTGVEGNNQADFIELYNAGTEIADLQGYSLWYQLKDGTEEILIHTWSDSTLVPPLGYYALTLEGQDFQIIPDLVINQALVPNKGGLVLRKGDSVEDQLVWGSGPASFTEGSAAIAMVPGSSLTRDLDPGTGPQVDSDNNQADFSLDPSPTLQNTGSPLNHPNSQDLSFTVSFPEVIKPGEQVQVELQVQNKTGMKLENLQASIPLPEYTFFQDEGEGFKLDDGVIIWSIPELVDGEDLSESIPIQAEYTFSNYAVLNSYLEADNWPLPTFVGPIYGEIGGGPIPVSTARELVDKEVVVEGISTMYVGGFYAGSGAKFYLEDETGGVQIYVSGAGNSLVVPLGSTVQVRGKIEIYRDSIELIPSTEDLVQIIAPPGESEEFTPTSVTIQEISTNGDAYTGQLVELEGRVARIEEFTYSYEIDLFDENGNMVTLYLDKETGITLEEFEADQSYSVTGILELLDGNLRLYPRLQTDLSRVYEPGLAIEVNPPTNAKPGEPFDTVYTVKNHSPDPDQNLVISAKVDPALEVLDVRDQGRMNNNTIVWDMDKIAGGEEISVSFQAQISGETEFIVFDDYRVISSTWSQSQYGITSYTFSGETVPIWAIQGTGNKSSYVLENLTTQGVVTGVFPELEGFWIQEKESDEDQLTSPGLFVSTGPNLPEVSPGDLVTVNGRVREVFQQTELEIISPANLDVIGRTALPAPIELDPPVHNQASLEYYEALEGVLVSVRGPANVVGPSTRYGEFSVVLAERELTRSWQNEDHGMLIHVDDGSSFTHQYRDTMSSAVSVGDQVFQITGPLAFTYGNYKIEPSSDYLAQARTPEVPSLEDRGEGFFSIMTWNVENLFDFVVPHPSSPPLPRVSEYKKDITKVALTIEAAGLPTIIGFQEVENIEILEDIAAEPVLSGYEYQAILIEGTDSRGIDVGYLVRGDQAEIIGQEQYPPPGNITSRPPLGIEIKFGDSTQHLFVLNNHFTSMSGGEIATLPRRNAQAAWNLEIAKDIQEENLTALLAIIGDLNSYYGSWPLSTLEHGGFVNVFDRLEPQERYTYIYEGNSQVLDHILVNGFLEALLVDVQVLHSNADFTLPYSNDESIIHKSDHDPVIAVFILP